MRHKMPKVGMLAGILVAFAAGAVAYPHKLAATHFYYVQELLAALLLFSIGFAVVTAVILILFLLDRSLYRALAWTGPYAAQRLHRGWVQVDQFGRKQFHRSEQPVIR
jgi:hypothetical protein